jgi:hypothetical protein
MQKKNLVEQIIKFNLMSIIPCHFNYFLSIITIYIYILLYILYIYYYIYIIYITIYIIYILLYIYMELR